MSRVLSGGRSSSRKGSSGGDNRDNKKSEEGGGGEPVVEKQDMEKLEKEEEDVEEKVEKRGRFNVGNIKVVKVGNKVAGDSDTDNAEKDVGEDKEDKDKEVPAENTETGKETVEEVVDEKSDKKEAEEEPEQNEEEEPKAIDSSRDERYLKFDEEIGRGSFKTVFKGEQLSLSNLTKCFNNLLVINLLSAAVISMFCSNLKMVQ